MIVDAFLHYFRLLSFEKIRLTHQLEEFFIEFAVFLLQTFLFRLNVCQLSFKFILLFDKLLVPEG